jgi:hypothetical protein
LRLGGGPSGLGARRVRRADGERLNLQAEIVSDILDNPETISTLLEVMGTRQHRQEGTAKMMKRLEGRVAVVTGGNSLATAKRLQQEGAPRRQFVMRVIETSFRYPVD